MLQPLTNRSDWECPSPQYVSRWAGVIYLFTCDAIHSNYFPRTIYMRNGLSWFCITKPHKTEISEQKKRWLEYTEQARETYREIIEDYLPTFLFSSPSCATKQYTECDETDAQYKHTHTHSIKLAERFFFHSFAMSQTMKSKTLPLIWRMKEEKN